MNTTICSHSGPQIASEESAAAGSLECAWQRDQLPAAIRELALDDQRIRNHLCWNVFYV